MRRLPLALLALLLPPWVPASEPARPASAEEISVISVPIRLSMNDLFARLRRKAPRGEDLSSTWTELPPGSGKWFRYAWERAPFDLSLKGLAFEANTRVKYRVKAGMKIKRFWASGEKMVSLGSVGFGEAMRRMDVRLRSELRFGEDWRLHSKTSIEPTFLDPNEVTFLKIDISSLLSRLMQQKLAEATADLDRKIPEKVNLRPLAERVWRVLARPLPLLGERAAVDLRPVGFGVSPLAGSGDEVTLKLELKARPEVHLGQVAAAAPAAPPLPPLGAAGDAEGFRLVMGARLDHDAAGRLLGQALRKRPLALPGGQRLLVKAARVTPQGSGLRVSLDVEGAVDGTLHLSGTPTLDQATREVHVPDLDMELESQGLLARFGNWLAMGSLKRALVSRTRFPIAGGASTLRKAADRLFARELPDGMQLKGELGDVEVRDLVVGPDAFHARLVLAGNVEVDAAPR